jgi:hypothetical protein
MGANLDPRRTGLGYAAREVTKAPSWHGLVAWDVFLNNLATGLFLVAALCDLAAPANFAAVARVAYPIALALLLADLIVLVLDLGDPLRFHHMLRVMKLGSPMSFGTWSLTLFSAILTVVVAIDLLRVIHLLPDGSVALEWVGKSAVVVGLLPAMGSAIYKGVLFSTSSQPAWKDARWLGGYLVNSAFLMGCAELIAIAILTGHQRAAVVLRPALGFLLVLNLIALGLVIADIREALARLGPVGYHGRIGALAIGVGSIIPLVLVLIGRSPPVMIGAVTCILLGSLAIRLLIIQLPSALRGGQVSPAEDTR